MKKKLVFVLFIFIPVLLFSQEFEHNRPAIGLNLGFDESLGIIAGGELSYPISKNYYINGKIRTPLSSLFDIQNDFGPYYKPLNYTSYSLGLGYLQKISSKFDLSFGLQYQYIKHTNFTNFFHLENEKNIILPIDLIFHINNRFAIKAGFSPTINLIGRNNRFRLCADPHVTFNLKF
ncbi:MAG TPA: hypothetical protein ENK91_08860 [Bacteroidetes bacterium]|nr:hypothetical protein [Bacteroidota bacterium]